MPSSCISTSDDEGEKKPADLDLCAVRIEGLYVILDFEWSSRGTSLRPLLVVILRINQQAISRSTSGTSNLNA